MQQPLAPPPLRHTPSTPSQRAQQAPVVVIDVGTLAPAPDAAPTPSAAPPAPNAASVPPLDPVADDPPSGAVKARATLCIRAVLLDADGHIAGDAWGASTRCVVPDARGTASWQERLLLAVPEGSSTPRSSRRPPPTATSVRLELWDMVPPNGGAQCKATATIDLPSADLPLHVPLQGGVLQLHVGLQQPWSLADQVLVTDAWLREGTAASMGARALSLGPGLRGVPEWAPVPAIATARASAAPSKHRNKVVTQWVVL